MAKDIRTDAAQKRYVRTAPQHFRTRSESDEPIIEGYFAVFNSDYELWEGASESIAPGAFDKTINGDIRALVNHDTTLVLGRTTAGTLELKTDEHGLWGRIRVNPNDQDAMNLHARVERGDVSQCSFGFFILDEEEEIREDGSHHWTLKDVDVFEVSCCTFPAYEETAIEARKADLANYQKRKIEVWRAEMLNRLKSNKEEQNNGDQSVNVAQED